MNDTLQMMVLDMPYMIGEQISNGSAAIWVNASMKNTVVRLYATEVDDLDSGEPRVGYAVSLEMFGFIAWYCSVIWVNDDGTAVTLMPLDFDPLPYFRHMEAASNSPISVQLSLIRTATQPITEDFDIDPMVRFAHEVWLLQQTELIENAMRVQLPAYDPFATFVNGELHGLDD
jgi:hypothetical protein